jgi:hypothetical protein
MSEAPAIADATGSIAVIVALDAQARFAAYSARSVSGQSSDADLSVTIVCPDAGNAAVDQFSNALGPDIPLSAVEDPDYHSAAVALRTARESGADIVILHSASSYWTSAEKLALQAALLRDPGIQYSWHQVVLRSANELAVTGACDGYEHAPSEQPPWESLAIKGTALPTLEREVKAGGWGTISTAASAHLRGAKAPGALAIVH